MFSLTAISADIDAALADRAKCGSQVRLPQATRQFAWTSLRGCFGGVLLVFWATLQGCTTYHVERLSRIELGLRRVPDAQYLGRHTCEPRVAKALTSALRDSDVAVRYYAAAALDGAQIASDELYDEALTNLVGLLDDVSFGFYSPRGERAGTGSVRARALLTLTTLTRQDFGYDQMRWDEWLVEGREQRRAAR